MFLCSKDLVLTKENVKDTGAMKELSQFPRSVLVLFSRYPLYLQAFPGGFPLLYEWTCGFYHFHWYSLNCGFAFLIVIEYSLCLVTGLQEIPPLPTKRHAIVHAVWTNSNWRTVWNMIVIACCSVYRLNTPFCWNCNLINSLRNKFDISKSRATQPENKTKITFLKTPANTSCCMLFKYCIQNLIFHEHGDTPTNQIQGL